LLIINNTDFGFDFSFDELFGGSVFWKRVVTSLRPLLLLFTPFGLNEFSIGADVGFLCSEEVRGGGSSSDDSSDSESGGSLLEGCCEWSFGSYESKL
jgi:hypothetical protein